MSAMPISVSTDPVHPAERKAFWTEAICRSFANIETKPLGSTSVSGHFEFVEIGRASSFASTAARNATVATHAS
jgi:AraC family transcriptional activator of tynA and feaB